MNIALFSDTYPPELNGVGTSTQSLKNILIKNGHNVIVVTTNPYNNEVMYENNTLRIPGIELKALYNYRLAWVYNAKCMKILRLFKPDLVHIQTEFGIGQFGLTVAKELQIPILYTYHTMWEEYAYYITKGAFDQLVRKILRQFSKTLVERRTTEIIIPSVKTRDYFRQIGVDSYINIIPTGIDFSKYSEENIDFVEVDTIRKNLGIAEDEFVFLSLGRVAKEKSIDICISAFAKLLKKKPNIKAKMVVVGGGPALEQLYELSDSLGIKNKVIFTGPVEMSETQKYYRLGNVFVSASISETQGLTYMEAIASSLPVLARFDANLIDVIQDNVTGYFFKDEDELVTLYERVMKLTDEERNGIILNAKRIIDNYSIETFYERINEVYLRAIKKNW